MNYLYRDGWLIQWRELEGGATEFSLGYVLSQNLFGDKQTELLKFQTTDPPGQVHLCLYEVIDKIRDRIKETVANEVNAIIVENIFDKKDRASISNQINVLSDSIPF